MSPARLAIMCTLSGQMGISEAKRLLDVFEAEVAAGELRDKFAMTALTGILAQGRAGSSAAAGYAYDYADAMLEARKTKNDEGESGT